MSKQKKTIIVAIAIVVVLVIVAFVCWASFRPQALEGVKEISVTVTHTDGSTRTEDFETTAQYLADALDGHIEIDGEDSEYGLFVRTVDGEYADDTQGVYWMFNVNGVMSEYGVDAQPVADGDVFSFYTAAH